MKKEKRVSLEEVASAFDKKIEIYIPRILDEDSLVFSLIGQPRYEYNLKVLNDTITAPIWEFLDRGGKRWRPKLLLLICEALGKNPKKFWDFAIVPEIIHNGTLIIDDIEDKSDIRRGKPSTHITFGYDVAINVGNALYFLPLLTLIKNDQLSKEKKVAIYEIFITEMIKLSFGQAMDIGWHKGINEFELIQESQYLQMCAYKTGALVRMGAKIAAVLADASDDQLKKIERFAEAIGLAFQIQDDILDLSGEEFGKKKGGRGKDITEGKKTLIFIHTMKKAKEPDKIRLADIINMHTTDAQLIEEATEIIKKYGSIEYAKDFARKIIKRSWEEVEKVFPSTRGKEKLKDFITFLIERKI